MQETWWRNNVETISALLALCDGNLPLTVDSPHEGPVIRSYYIVINFILSKLLTEQSSGWWFEAQWRSWDDATTMSLLPTLQISDLCWYFSVITSWSSSVSSDCDIARSSNCNSLGNRQHCFYEFQLSNAHLKPNIISICDLSLLTTISYPVQIAILQEINSIVSININ